MTKDPGVLDNSEGIKQCECHGEPMSWSADHRAQYTAGGYWRCQVKIRDGQRAAYQTWSGRRYNRRLMTNRRNKALARQRVRHEAAI